MWKRWLVLGLGLVFVVLAVVVFMVGQKLLIIGKPIVPASIVSKKEEEKGQILKGQIVKYDIGSLTVAIDGGNEMYFSSLDRVSVWKIKDDGTGERPQKADWSKVAVGQKVSLSMDETGQKLISVIIL